MLETNTNANSKAAQANRIVRNYSLGAVAPGFVPFPWLDLALLAGIQLKMLHRLATLYQVDFSSQLGKSSIAALVGVSLPRCLTGYFVPIFGRLVGMFSTTLFSVASTYAVGKVFIQHFESGGTLLTFDPDKVKAYYAQQFETGKSEFHQSFAGKKP